jgi:riboflavin kinase/FMN adenylyltransferase
MATPIVARSLKDAKAMAVRNSAVTLGVFDGIHIGHKRIIEELVQLKRTGKVDHCILITFDPHPLVVTHSKMTPPMLTTIVERIDLLKAFDLDGIFVVNFDDELSVMDYRVFVDKYLLQSFDMKHLVLGYDCHFGKNREGSPEQLRLLAPKKDFKISIIPAVVRNEEIISSTKIRNALMEGDLSRANELLGHPYLIGGSVVRGHGMGRQLGFPTANLAISDPYKLWPPQGVYAVRVLHRSEMFNGMMNIGRAPTMKTLNEGAREIEVHLFDFEGDLYDAYMLVYCHSYLRRERAFPSPEGLADQLREDQLNAIRILEEDGIE